MIYAIQAGKGGPIKFGKAKQPLDRLSELQTGCPDKLELLAASLVHDDNERLIHAYLRPDRLHGEWFMPTERALGIVSALRIWPDYPTVINHIAERQDTTASVSAPKTRGFTDPDTTSSV